LPLSIFAAVPGIGPIVCLPIAGYDDNRHAANENIRVENLRYGTETFAEILGSLHPCGSR
jgi:acetylornithine deacetylase/succinyl-diaminopimelate desuccinylase-like protein